MFVYFRAWFFRNSESQDGAETPGKMQPRDCSRNALGWASERLTRRGVHETVERFNDTLSSCAFYPRRLGVAALWFRACRRFADRVTCPFPVRWPPTYSVRSCRGHKITNGGGGAACLKGSRKPKGKIHFVDWNLYHGWVSSLIGSRALHQLASLFNDSAGFRHSLDPSSSSLLAKCARP